MPSSSFPRSFTVSVIVPVYNAEKRLRPLLDALAEQTAQPTTVFLVDDGSKDRSGEAAEEWGREHPGFPLEVVRQPNRGPAAARNLGSERSRGDLVVFMDSDCIPDTAFVAGMLAPFANEEVVGVQGAYRSDQKEWVARFCQIEIEERYARMRRAPYIDFVGTYAAAYRRKVFVENGLFDTRFPIASGEDTEFSFRLADRGLKMVFQPNALVSHRHPTTIRSYLRQKYWRAVWRNLIYRRHRSRMAKDSYTPNALKIQTILGILFPFSLIAVPLSFPWDLIPFCVLGGILLSFLPFTFWVARRDLNLAFATPVILFLRTAVFAVGAAHGFFRGLWFGEKYH